MTLGRVLRAGLVLLAFGLGAYAVARDANRFAAATASIGVGNGLAALALVLVGLLCSAGMWRACVGSTAGLLPWPAALQVFFVSQLGKYLPGGVWTVLAQVDAAKRHRLSRSRMGVGALLFLVFHLLTALLVAAVLLPWSTPELLGSYGWSFVFALPLLVALVPPVLSRLTNGVLQRVRRDPLPRPLGARDVVVPLAWLVPTWLAYGAALFVLLRPLATDASAGSLFVLATGSFALAWAVGLLIVPAPAGLGAREVVLYLALVPVAGAAGATSVAIVVRVVHTVADLLLATGHLRRLRP